MAWFAWIIVFGLLTMRWYVTSGPRLRPQQSDATQPPNDEAQVRSNGPDMITRPVTIVSA